MKLVNGSGAPGKGACWMSALHWYTRADKPGFQWSDHPECVDPVIRTLCISLNDSLSSDEQRGEIIGPHLFKPVGTMVSRELTIQRAFKCADVAIRKFAVGALRSAKLNAEADKLEMLPEIKSEAASEAASDAASWAASAASEAASEAASRAASAASRAASDAASWAASAASEAASAASEAASRAASAASRAASWAASAASRAASAASRAASEAAKMKLDLILELCDMGTTEVRCELTKSQVVEFIDGGCK